MKYWGNFSAYCLIDKISNFKNSTMNFKNILKEFYLSSINIYIQLRLVTYMWYQKCNDSDDGQRFMHTEGPSNPGQWWSPRVPAHDRAEVTSRLHILVESPLTTLSLSFLLLEGWGSKAHLKVTSKIK